MKSRPVGFDSGMMGQSQGQSVDAIWNMMGMFDQSPRAATDYNGLLLETQGDLSNGGLLGPEMQLSGWGQFASLVSSGLGNLNSFV